MRYVKYVGLGLALLAIAYLPVEITGAQGKSYGLGVSWIGGLGLWGLVVYRSERRMGDEAHALWAAIQVVVVSD